MRLILEKGDLNRVGCRCRLPRLGLQAIMTGLCLLTRGLQDELPSGLGNVAKVLTMEAL